MRYKSSSPFLFWDFKVFAWFFVVPGSSGTNPVGARDATEI